MTEKLFTGTLNHNQKKKKKERDGEGFFLSVQNYFYHILQSTQIHSTSREAWLPSGRASDSGARGQGFDLHLGRRVVSLSKIHLPPKKYW